MEYDALIIGFGKAGKTLAVRLATAGQRVYSNQNPGKRCRTGLRVG